MLIADNRWPAAADDPASAPSPARLDPVHLEQALAALAPLVDDLVWVTSDPAALLGQDGLIVRDHFQPPSLLSAIHAGLFAARHDHLLVLSAGAPPFSRPLLELLVQAVAPRWDGVLLETAGTAHVLPAVYHKRCLKLLARQLAEGRTQAGGFLRQLHRHLIPGEQVHRAGAQWAPPFSSPTSKTKE
jgi:molybdopterin-guanine dinucleotide biosynthesis protein A